MRCTVDLRLAVEGGGTHEHENQADAVHAQAPRHAVVVAQVVYSLLERIILKLIFLFIFVFLRLETVHAFQNRTGQTISSTRTADPHHGAPAGRVRGHPRQQQRHPHHAEHDPFHVYDEIRRELSSRVPLFQLVLAILRPRVVRRFAEPCDGPFAPKVEPQLDTVSSLTNQWLTARSTYLPQLKP